MLEMNKSAAPANIGQFVHMRAVYEGEREFAYFPGRETLTFLGLDHLSSRLSSKLISLGLKRGNRVMLLANPSPEQLISLVACWKLGLLAAPADRFIAAEGLDYLVKTFKPSLVIIDPELAQAGAYRNVCQKAGLPVMELSVENLPKEEAAPLELEPSTPALCVFTSGSTGVPKGVVLSHSNLFAGARYVVASHHVGSTDRVLCVLPLSHLNGMVTTFITPLFSGGQVVFMPSFSPAEALRLIDKYSCTWFSAVPTHYTLMVTPPVDRKEWSLRTLRFCRSASAPLPPRILTEFEAHYCAPIIETMGTTETSGQIFSNPMPPAKHKSGSVGLPVGFEVQLRNEEGMICPEGVPGEIYLRGDGVMLGYLDDPVETVKAFDGEWFKTGDIAVRDEDGFYFIKGRKKDIAIFCGLNISLAAMQAAVHEEGIVQDVTCRGEEHPVFGEVVGVYAIPKPGRTDFDEAAERIMACLKPLTPNAQAVRGISFVLKFPRSSAGKVLKGRLDEVEVIYRRERQLSEDPALLLSQVLDIPLVDVHDDLGFGRIPQWDSLGYVALIAAVETVLQRRLGRRETAALMTFKGLKLVLSGHAETLTGSMNADPVREIINRLKDVGYGSDSVTYLIIGFEHCARLGAADVGEVVDALIESLPSSVNLVMNAFTWKFCQGVNYHYRKSPCETGLINEVFRLHDGVLRSRQPIYSYAAWGPDREELMRHTSDTCWGEGSVTSRLLDRTDVRMIIFGLPDLRGSMFRANPGVHTLEERHRVPYRFFKTFKGLADFGEGYIPYETRMYVRPLDDTVENDWTAIHTALEYHNLAVKDPVGRTYTYMNHDLKRIGNEILKRDPYALCQPHTRGRVAKTG